MLTPGWGTETRGGSPPGVKLGSLLVTSTTTLGGAPLPRRPAHPPSLTAGSTYQFNVYMLVELLRQGATQNGGFFNTSYGFGHDQALVENRALLPVGNPL